MCYINSLKCYLFFFRKGRCDIEYSSLEWISSHRELGGGVGRNMHPVKQMELKQYHQKKKYDPHFLTVFIPVSIAVVLIKGGHLCLGESIAFHC